MGDGKMRQHRLGQPKTRNYVAIDSHFRSSAGAMGKHGKGRVKTDSRSRSSVKVDLRRGMA